jgi:hypothetical protein
VVSRADRRALKWFLSGALIAGGPVFALHFVSGLQRGPDGTTTLYQTDPLVAVLLSGLFGVGAGAIGGFIGAIAERIVPAGDAEGDGR